MSSPSRNKLNSNKENINAFKNYCPTFATTHGNTAIKNALLVNLNSADGSENRIGYVSKSTASIPTDCHAGVREVYYFNKTEVWLKISCRICYRYCSYTK